MLCLEHYLYSTTDQIRSHLRGKPHRILFTQIELADGPPATTGETTLIDQGDIWARAWRLPAGTSPETPDLSQSGGRFFVPLWGTVEYNGRQYPQWSAIYVGSHDGPIVL
jgi:hypothetical protein